MGGVTDPGLGVLPHITTRCTERTQWPFSGSGQQAAETLTLEKRKPCEVSPLCLGFLPGIPFWATVHGSSNTTSLNCGVVTSFQLQTGLGFAGQGTRGRGGDEEGLLGVSLAKDRLDTHTGQSPQAERRGA